jgi:serine phosphatase RsbU (regulator of sigma subunit)
MTAGHRPVLELGWAGTALEEESGDVHVFAELEAGALVAVIDGLGHGFEAAVAARAAARILESFAAEPLAALVDRCHEALRQTRGAVMSLAAFDARASRMTWAGIGNVEGVLLRAGAPAARRETITLRGGIVGYQLPALRTSTLSLSPGDTLFLATDGIRDVFTEELPSPATPQQLADAILARHSRGSDDALVLVARYLGGASGPGEVGG